MSKRDPSRTSKQRAKQDARLRADLDAVRRAERLEHRISQAHTAPPTTRAAVFADAVVFARSVKGRRLRWFDLPDLLEELSRAQAELGRTDEALASAQEAIDAGLVGEPDPRCVLAEINYRAGRHEQADAIWAQVHAQTPEDVWLYNHVGMEKHHGGQHDQAVEWLGRGLELLQRQGDPERLVDQLITLRAASMAALGLPDDDLQRQARAFRLASAALHATRTR